MAAQLIVGFTHLSQADFLNQAQRIVAAMTDNPHFPEPWPASVPPLSQITVDLDSFQHAQIAALDGGRSAIAARNTSRGALNGAIQQLAQYVMLEAQGDAGKLSTTGFDLRRSAARSLAEVLPAPANLRVERGDTSGTLLVRTRALPGAACYEVQYCSGDPTQAQNWKDGGTFTRCSRMTLETLTPGTMYFIRVRGVGGAGPGAWTASTSLMAV